MPQMSVKPFSARYMRWALGTAAASMIPPLHNVMPMYRKVKTFTELGDMQVVRETQTMPLSTTESEAARRTIEGVPSAITRSIALVRLSDVTVLGNTGSVIDEKGQHLFRIRRGRTRPTYHELRAEPTTRVVKKEAAYFNMLGPHKSHSHYFHFLIDYLPQIYWFLEHFDAGREPVIVLVNEDLSPLQEAVFGALARRYTQLRFERVPRSQRWAVPTLYQIDDYHYTPEIDDSVGRTFMSPGVLAFLRDTLFAAYGVQKPKTANRRLYVSRNDSGKRRLLNEDGLSAALQRNGFEIIAPGTLSHGEQVSLFAQARIICGPHGAGLTNLLFAPAGTHIIEILPANRIVAIFLMLAKSAGHTYEAIAGSSELRHQNFACNTDQAAAALDALDKPSEVRSLVREWRTQQDKSENWRLVALR